MKKDSYAGGEKDDLKIETLPKYPSYVPLSEIVYQNLKKAILDGTLAPGQILSENKIAAKLEVSRTPVREAIRRLEVEKLVTVLSGRKVAVTVPTVDDIEDIYGIRLIVESEALRRITPDNRAIIEQLEEYLKKGQKQLAENDYQGLGQSNTEFHLTIISALKNRRMEQFIDSLHDTISLYRLYSLTDKQWARDSEVEHSQIVLRLKKGDTEGAVKILTQHLIAAKEILISMFLAKE